MQQKYAKVIYICLEFSFTFLFQGLTISKYATFILNIMLNYIRCQ